MFHLQPNSIVPSRIAILYGGSSPEREISLESGNAVFEALTHNGHLCQRIDPAVTPLAQVEWNAFEVVFIALHGEFGEDGQLQAFLDDVGIPYTGSDAASSKLAFHKSNTKRRFRERKLPTPDSVVIHEQDTARKIRQAVALLDYPLVVKPDAQGSSVGITIVNSPDRLPSALARCFHYGRTGLIERYVDGQEWTVSVVNGQPLEPLCISTERQFYDYAAKYHDDRTAFKFETNTSPQIVQRIRELGQQAVSALGCVGAVRADIRLDRFSQPWLLEVNTIPGLTSHSLLPLAAAQAGISFAELCEHMICAAISHENPSRETSPYLQRIPA